MKAIVTECARGLIKRGFLGIILKRVRTAVHCVGIVNKKDGYRQQNVRQRQKLISTIDYDVCILEYLQPFWRYSTSTNGMTLKSGYGVLQGR